MQRGTIDAFEYSTIATNWDMHFNEVAPYMYLSPTRAPSDPQVFFVNKEAFNALPADLQEIVTTEISRWSQAQHEYLVFQSVNAVDKFKAAGVEVYKVPAEIDAALTVAANEFYKEKSAEEDPIFGEIYQSMKTYGEAYAALH